MLMRCVTSTFDCRTRTPKQSSQACVGIAKDDVRILGCSHNGGESITLKS